MEQEINLSRTGTGIKHIRVKLHSMKRTNTAIPRDIIISFKLGLESKLNETYIQRLCVHKERVHEI